MSKKVTIDDVSLKIDNLRNLIKLNHEKLYKIDKDMDSIYAENRKNKFYKYINNGNIILRRKNKFDEFGSFDDKEETAALGIKQNNDMYPLVFYKLEKIEIKGGNLEILSEITIINKDTFIENSKRVKKVMLITDYEYLEIDKIFAYSQYGGCEMQFFTEDEFNDIKIACLTNKKKVFIPYINKESVILKEDLSNDELNNLKILDESRENINKDIVKINKDIARYSDQLKDLYREYHTKKYDNDKEFVYCNKQLTNCEFIRKYHFDLDFYVEQNGLILNYSFCDEINYDNRMSITTYKSLPYESKLFKISKSLFYDILEELKQYHIELSNNKMKKWYSPNSNEWCYPKPRINKKEYI